MVKKDNETSTAHLKLIPPTRELRARIRDAAARVAERFDRSHPLTRETLRSHAEALLHELVLPPGYLGFAMVTISNEFWREQFMAVDFKRRLLLLPRCLKCANSKLHAANGPGPNCKECGSCNIADFKVGADDLGYRVLMAEGTPTVLKIITTEKVDAILGVACLNVLERAFDKVLAVGVPALAVPLLSNSCLDSSVDADWVAEVVRLRTRQPVRRTRSYLPLLRLANEICSGTMLETLAPRTRPAPPPVETIVPLSGGEEDESDPDSKPAKVARVAVPPDPIAATEQLGYEWLASGGKRFRPFIALAACDAMQGGKATQLVDADELPQLPDPVKRVAMAMEVFHKASLVHDDIEDDDTYRYGSETLHRRHGVPTAINVGDYLIGLGYRLVSRESKALGAEVVADILDRLAQAHQKLTEGQGAELTWRDGPDKGIKSLDALKIYALKTAPAFEVALYAGLRMAGPVDGQQELIARFSRYLGVAFQIINDLKDWGGDDDNKLARGQDVLSARPTLLLALALETATPEQRAELRHILGDKINSGRAVRRARQIYTANKVFARAEAIVQKFRDRAKVVASGATPEALRELLCFLVDTALDREPAQTTEPVRLV